MRAAFFSSALSLVAACAEVHAPAQSAEQGLVDAGMDGLARPAAAAESAAAAVSTAMPPQMRRRVIDSVSHSSTDLTIEYRPDGISRVDLRGRFHSVSVVSRDASGRLQRRCADDPATVERLLEGATR